ncbi:hypothetical protein JCM11491_002718 [Sporobolomyces phaffii]
MPRPTHRTLLVLVALGIVACAQAAARDVEPHPTSHREVDPLSLTLYHRFTTPRDPDSRWIERGTITVPLASQFPADDQDPAAGGVDFVPSATAWDAVDVPTALDELDGDGLVGTRYEVTVRKPGQDTGSFVSVDPCRLFSTTPGSTIREQITLQGGPAGVRRTARTSFTGLQYATVGGTDACGASPVERRAAQFALADGTATTTRTGRTSGNVEIKIREAFEIPTPVLPEPVEPKQPVQLDKEGKVVPPPPPKSFIQKYWIYIVPVLVVLMMGGGEEGEQKKQ